MALNATFRRTTDRFRGGSRYRNFLSEHLFLINEQIASAASPVRCESLAELVGSLAAPAARRDKLLARADATTQPNAP